MLGDDKAAFLAQAFETSRSLFPGVLTIDAVEYDVARSALDQSEQQAIGGFEPGGSVAVRILISEFPGTPELEVAVDLDGEAMRTKRLMKDPGGVTWYLELEPA